jgi:hypothetical protein
MIGFKSKFLSQIPWWGYMMGPSLPNRQSYPIFAWGAVNPITPQTANTRCGRGMIVNIPQNCAANTPYIVTHNLGRIPQALIMISNQYSFPPRIAFASGPRTNVQIAVQFDQACSFPQFWVL